MAYTRFGQYDSDVYVYEHANGHIHCCACALIDEDPGCWETTDPAAMCGHLADHVAAYHEVPDLYRGSGPLYDAIMARAELHP